MPPTRTQTLTPEAWDQLVQCIRENRATLTRCPARARAVMVRRLVRGDLRFDGVPIALRASTIHRALGFVGVG